MPSVLPTWDYEQTIVADGGEWIIGLDEVGRGCLAGPVTLGSAIFSADQIGTPTIPEGLKDSKLLTPARREKLIEPVRSWAHAVGLGSCTNTEIDQWGISYCLGLAGLKAICAVEKALINAKDPKFLPQSKVAVILDGPYDYISPVIYDMQTPDLPVIPRIYTMVKADQHCASVSAASVYAKVQRDHYMEKLAHDNPQWDMYEWAKNKGYGSSAHRQAIRQYGITPYHRSSWKLQ